MYDYENIGDRIAKSKHYRVKYTNKKTAEKSSGLKVKKLFKTNLHESVNYSSLIRAALPLKLLR